MRLTTLTAVVLRLFAIYWAMSCVIGFVAAIGVAGMVNSSGMAGYLQYAIPFMAPTVYGFLGLLTWRFADAISLRVVGRSDPTLSFDQITTENFFALGILGFGLYFCLSHLAPMINWIHYLAINRAGDAVMSGRNGLSLYEVTSQVIPCVAGAAVAVMSPKLGRKLARASASASLRA